MREEQGPTEQLAQCTCYSKHQSSKESRLFTLITSVEIPFASFCSVLLRPSVNLLVTIGRLSIGPAKLIGIGFIRTDTIGNAAPRKLGNGSADSVGDLIIVDLFRYQTEERIAI